MDLSKLTSRFEQFVGFDPMPWQSRLYREYFDQGKLPASVDIPTGLGKTAVMALWLIAIRDGRKLPRRLVYVVDRRAVVELAAVDGQVIRGALKTDFADFEDTVVHEAGCVAGMDAIVTRDPKGFRKSTLPVLSPQDLLAVLANTEGESV
jgi:CRISPR-associated helicase Cas3